MSENELPKTHSDYIAEWMEDLNDADDAKRFFEKFKDPFEEPFFRFDDEKDDVLELAGAGDNKCFKEMILDLFGEDILEKCPDRDIFEHSEEDDWYNDRLDTDKLDDYHDKFNKQYLDDLNLLTVYENNVMGESTSAFQFYVISFDQKKIYVFAYEEYDEGDEQNLTLKKTVKFG